MLVVKVKLINGQSETWLCCTHSQLWDNVKDNTAIISVFIDQDVLIDFSNDETRMDYLPDPDFDRFKNACDLLGINHREVPNLTRNVQNGLIKKALTYRLYNVDGLSKTKIAKLLGYEYGTSTVDQNLRYCEENIYNKCNNEIPKIAQYLKKLGAI